MCMNFKKLCEIVGLLIIPVTLKKALQRYYTAGL